MSHSTLPEANAEQRPTGLPARLTEAIRFLTIIPVPGAPAAGVVVLAQAVALFPLVGALLGALLALVGLAGGWLWGEGVRAVLVVIAWAALTAGLHLDGLSDTFDGVLSWRPRERKLEIMRDSRVGVMGLLALASVLGLKAALLALPQARLSALLLAPVLGRWSLCYGLSRFPAARSDGLGAPVQARLTSAGFYSATCIALVLALLIGGPAGLIALALVWLVCYGLARWWMRELGGLTGDTYGALCEISEVVALAVLTARI